MSATPLLDKILAKRAADATKPAAPAVPVMEKALWGKDGPFQQPATNGEAPGFVSNVASGLARGHVPTVVGTGAAAILAGVLAYQLMKKKSPARARRA